jgi:tetratricopeptide (TPR) repeat protein
METKIYNKAKNALLELMKYDDQYEDAVVKMIQLKIRSDPVSDTLGFIQQNLENLSSAAKSLALYNMGTLYYKNGNYYEAVDSWKNAYSLNSSNKDLQNMITRYSILINNQNLRGLFTEDAAQVEAFIKKLMKNNMISNITKMKKYWAFQSYDAFYVIYRVPQPIAPEELLEIKETVSKSFNKVNSFTLYSLYGIEYYKTYEADVKDLFIVTEKDFLALVNSNVC